MLSCHYNKEIDFKGNGPDLNVVKCNIIYTVYVILKHACVVWLRNKIFCALKAGERETRTVVCNARGVRVLHCNSTSQALFNY